MLNFEEEKAITIDLLEEESIQTEVADINYIPSYKVAETERQANEKERIANEEEREAAYNKLTEMIKEGKVTGIYIGEEQPTDVFTEVWIDPNGNPEVEASKIVFSDNETLQTKYENGELKGDKGDTGDKGQDGRNGIDGYTPVKGVDYFTEEDKTSLNIPTNEQILNLIYPAGAVYISETNTNPSALFGGTWELVDKEFTPTMGSVPVTLSEANSCTVHCSKAGHTIYMRIQFVNKNELTETQTTIGTINIESLGVTDLSYQKFANGYTDSGQGVIMTSLSGTGELVVSDVLEKSSGTIPAGNTCFVDYVHVVNTGSMLDSACDKFYWKRTG